MSVTAYVSRRPPKRGVQILLRHKILDQFGVDLPGMEILTRGGGLWVSSSAQATSNDGWARMSRRSSRGSAMALARRCSDRVARGLLLPPRDRKSVEPIAARVQPRRVQAAHQSLPSQSHRPLRNKVHCHRNSMTRPNLHSTASIYARSFHRLSNRLSCLSVTATNCI